MAYLLDGAIVVLFILLVWLGHRRGFIKTVAGVVTFVAALVLSSMLSGPVSGFIYNTLVEPPVTQSLSTHLGEDSPAAEQLDAAFAQMPAFITNSLEAKGIDGGAAMLDHLAGTQENETIAQSITRQIVEPVVTPVLKALCMLLLFLVLLIVLTVVLKAVDLVAKLPLLKQLNKSLGVVAGILQGILWVFFAVTVLQLVASAGWFDWLPVELLESTVVIHWIDSLNPMTTALRDMVVVTI